MRRDHILQYALGLRIGQHALHTAAGLDAQPAQCGRIVLRHHQQHAIIDALAPQFPCIEHADAVLLDRFRFGSGKQQDRDLAAGALLILLQYVFQRGLLVLAQHAGLVGHTRLQRRHRHELLRERRRQEQRRHQGEQGAQHGHGLFAAYLPKSTLGAVEIAFSFSTVNDGLTS